MDSTECWGSGVEWSGVRRGSVGLVEGCREEVWVPPQSVGVWAWGSWKECGFKGVQGRNVGLPTDSRGLGERGVQEGSMDFN